MGKRRVHHRHPDKPQCHGCGKDLVWHSLIGVPRGRSRFTTTARRRLRRNTARLAFRCTDCFGVFCARCSRKHFAPMLRAQRAVDKALEKLAIGAMRKIGKVCA